MLNEDEEFLDWQGVALAALEGTHGEEEPGYTLADLVDPGNRFSDGTHPRNLSQAGSLSMSNKWIGHRSFAGEM